jgi:hypothetical protein
LSNGWNTLGALFQRYRRQGTIAASKVEYDHQRT